MTKTLRRIRSSQVALMVLAFAALYFIWGSTYLAIAIAIETMPPLSMLGFRFGVAGLIMFGFLMWRGAMWPTPAQWRAAFLVGTLMLCFGTGSAAIAMQYIASGLTALIITTVPLWMVLMDWLWKGGPRPSPAFFGGFLLGLLGVFLLIDPQTYVDGLQMSALAMLGVVFGAMCWSAGSIHGKSADLPDDPFMSTAIQMFAGGVALVVAGWLTGEEVSLGVELFSSRSLVAWLYLLVFGSFIAFSAYIWLMRNTTPARVSTYAYVNPVVAMYLGWAFNNEPITSRILIASMLLITAVVIVIRFAPRAKREPAVAVESCYQVEGSA